MSGSSRKGLSGVCDPPPAKQAKGAVCNQVLHCHDWPWGSPCGGCSEVLRRDQVKGRDPVFRSFMFSPWFLFFIFPSEFTLCSHILYHSVWQPISYKFQ